MSSAQTPSAFRFLIIFYHSNKQRVSDRLFYHLNEKFVQSYGKKRKNTFIKGLRNERLTSQNHLSSWTSLSSHCTMAASMEWQKGWKTVRYRKIVYSTLDSFHFTCTYALPKRGQSPDGALRARQRAPSAPGLCPYYYRSLANASLR